ncbi:hypothetical protein CR513_13074, partial [Mucuna pruriens]
MEAAIRDLAKQRKALKNDKCWSQRQTKGHGSNLEPLPIRSPQIKPRIKALTVETVGPKQSFHPISSLVKTPGSLERKMTLHTHDDTPLIHFFQESLTGAALRWYLGLKSEHIPTWRSLAEGFLNQYKYNLDMALDCSQLQNMAKGENETFKEYA